LAASASQDFTKGKRKSCCAAWSGTTTNLVVVAVAVAAAAEGADQPHIDEQPDRSTTDEL